MVAQVERAARRSAFRRYRWHQRAVQLLDRIDIRVAVLAAEVIGAAIGRIVIGVKAIAGEDDAVIALIGKAATAHGVGALGIERASVEDFCVQADARDAIAIEIKTGADLTTKALVIAEGLGGIELSSGVKGEQ